LSHASSPLLIPPHHATTHPPTHPPQDDVARTTFLRKKKKRFEVPAQHAPGAAYHATIAKLQALYKGRIRELEEKVGRCLFWGGEGR
jgi:hypothetical protein